VIRVPGDKSVSHRALLLAALAEGESRLRGVLPGGDCRSTARVLRALGASIPELPDDGGEIRIPGMGLQGLRTPDGPLDCGNSGTTARLLLGLLSGLPIEAVITGDASLRSRPMRRVTEPLGAMGADFEEDGDGDRLPIRVRGGGLRSLTWESPVASAQVKSALLLAGLTGGVPVEVAEPVRSRDHTERMLRRMGAGVEEGPAGTSGLVGNDGSWGVHLSAPPETLRPLDLQVPGDFSSAAFLLVWGLLGGGSGSGEGGGPPLRIGNVGLNPTRTGLLDVLRGMGARIRVRDRREFDEPWGEPAGELEVEPGPLDGVTIGGGLIPSLIDEIPVLAVAAARARGVTEIRDAAELRVKESDRIRVLAENLAAVGVRVEELPDGLRIHGAEAPLEGRVRSRGDHRIAMAFGILGALPGCRIEMDDPKAADVSFPGFWELLGELSGKERRSGPAGGGVPVPGAALPDIVVTLDGPAGSGKSTTAREVARRLGLRHLDSGALYRALTLAVLESGIPEDEWGELSAERLRSLDIRLEADDGRFSVFLDGRDPGEDLRSPRVTSRVASVAAIPAVRKRLLGLQQGAAKLGGLVADGRDMGTVVFPGADLKVYLTASLEERARRRLLQEGRDADPGSVAAEATRIQARDASDAGRAASPLRRPEGALVVDTTELDFQAQVERIVEAARGLTPSEGFD
jgi:3-phosphoshikimate 1-carboxyvinyltransferase